jgi:CO/xanthine dehydrogenase Mo-binding subunit
VTEPSTGKGIDRLDARLKVAGKATYAAEFATANVAFGVIVVSPGGKGRLSALDTAAAEGAPGVITVLSHKNAPKLPGASKKLDGIDRVVQIFQDDQVHYAEQPIALVVADTLEHARYAATLVRPTIDAATPALSMEAERPRAFAPKSLNGKPPDTNKGDFDKAFADAKVKVEQTYSTPDEHHNPMEMHATLAVWQGDGKVTVYDSTQGISGVQKKVAAIFDLKPEDVRVITHYVGGGFGCKGSPWSHIPLAVMAAKVTQRPVKVMLTRPQMFGFVGHRPTTFQKIAIRRRPRSCVRPAKQRGPTRWSARWTSSPTPSTSTRSSCASATTPRRIPRTTSRGRARSCVHVTSRPRTSSAGRGGRSSRARRVTVTGWSAWAWRPRRTLRTSATPRRSRASGPTERRSCRPARRTSAPGRTRS